MRSKADRAVSLTAATTMLLALGCGGGYDASVRGLVTLEGTVVPRGTVKFNPVGAGPTGYGEIDATGAYAIVTGREEGLPAGDYVVTVVANQPSTAATNPSLPPVPGKPITPDWYREKDKSPLSKTVASGDNEINLELTKTPPAGYVAPRGGR